MSNEVTIRGCGANVEGAVRRVVALTGVTVLVSK